MNIFRENLRFVETFLTSYYETKILSHVGDHLLDRNDLQDLIATNPAEKSQKNSLASTWFIQDADQLWAGVFFDPMVVARLEKNSPLLEINSKNLNDFLIVAEEISHFHFVLNRFDRMLPVSKMEIEMQGEIDKLVVCSYLLLKQSGKDHIEQLFSLLFDSSKIYAPDAALYENSSRHAAMAFLKALKSAEKESSWERINGMREMLKDLYFLQGRSKLEHFAKVS